MIRNTKDCIEDKIVIVVYGESGAGKTTLIKTIKGTPLIINAENGLRSIADAGIDYFDLTKSEINGVVTEIGRIDRFNKLDMFLRDIHKYREKYDWLVFDSLTEIAQNLVEGLKFKHEGNNNHYVMWGDYKNHIEALVKMLRDVFHFNVLFLALDNFSSNEEGVRFHQIDVPGSASRTIPAMVDEVFYLKKFVNQDGNEERLLLTDTYKNFLAKDRSGKLNQFEKPDLGLIMDKIKS